MRKKIILSIIILLGALSFSETSNDVTADDVITLLNKAYENESDPKIKNENFVKVYNYFKNLDENLILKNTKSSDGSPLKMFEISQQNIFKHDSGPEDYEEFVIKSNNNDKNNEWLSYINSPEADKALKYIFFNRLKNKELIFDILNKTNELDYNKKVSLFLPFTHYKDTTNFYYSAETSISGLNIRHYPKEEITIDQTNESNFNNLSLGYNSLTNKQINDNSIKDGIAIGNFSIFVNNAVSFGNPNLLRKLVFVENGDITPTSTDAINGRQIYELLNNASVDGIPIKEDVWKKSLGINSGVSLALAAASMPQVSENKKFMITAGTGYFEKELGFALGFSGQNNNKNLVYKIGSMLNTKGKFGLNAGIGYAFGEISKNEESNKEVDNPSLNKLLKENENLKNDNNDLKQKYLILEEKLNKLLDKEDNKFVNNSTIITITGFEIGKSNLSNTEIITNNIKKLKEAKEIIIHGYTDTRGELKYNLNLGLKRALFVMNKLISLGVSRDKIMIKSSGYSTIVNKGNSSENRRVDITIKK